MVIFYHSQDKTVVVADFGLARIMPQNNWTAERKKFGKKHARKKRLVFYGVEQALELSTFYCDEK